MKIKIQIKSPKARMYFEPKRADVFADKRTKRERTRQQKNDRAIKEFAKE